jgi:hypothetical protein
MLSELTSADQLLNAKVVTKVWVIELDLSWGFELRFTWGVILGKQRGSLKTLKLIRKDKITHLLYLVLINFLEIICHLHRVTTVLQFIMHHFWLRVHTFYILSWFRDYYVLVARFLHFCYDGEWIWIYWFSDLSFTLTIWRFLTYKLFCFLFDV